MVSQKLLDYILSLSRVEMTQLGKFVRSPFFNTNQHVIDLYDYLDAQYPKFDSSNCHRQLLFAKVFPGKPFKDASIRNVISDLIRLIEQYLTQKTLEQVPAQQQFLVIDALQQRGLERYAQKALHKTQNQLVNYPYRDGAYYFDQHRLDEINYEFTLRQQNRKIGGSLQQLVDNLDHYYLAKKLKYSCEIINRKNVLAEDYELHLVDEIYAYLANTDVSHVPIIQIYYQVLLTLMDSKNEEHYARLKELVSSYNTLFPKEENKIIYGFAQNYCIKKINQGKQEYLNELFKLFKETLQNEVLFEGNHLSQWDFKNIVIVGLRLNEIEWTEQFIHDYAPSIHPDHRQNAYNYNLAYLHFYKQAYGKAMELLQDVKFTDVYYNLDSKSLLLKSYFELGEYEPLFTLVDNLTNYLNRNDQISSYQKKVYKNLARFIEKLADIKLKGESIPDKLKEEINNTKETADITWLRKKVAEAG